MTAPEVSVDEAVELARGGALLLDVRNDDEWTAGHAPDARYVTLGRIPDEEAQLPHERRIVAVCRSGARSGRATEYLRSKGFDVVNLAGGMQAWAAQGHPVVRDDGTPGTVI